MLAKFWCQLPKRADSNEWFGIFASSSSSSSKSTSLSSSSLLLLLQLCVHTLVPSLESLHQRCPVNTRQKHSSQDHSFQNAHDATKQSNNYVEEEREVWHNGKQSSERKKNNKKNNDIVKKFTFRQDLKNKNKCYSLSLYLSIFIISFNIFLSEKEKTSNQARRFGTKCSERVYDMRPQSFLGSFRGTP